MSIHDWTYAGFALTGTDEDGVLFTVERSSGWRSGPGIRLEREPKAQQDGDWPSKPNRAAREITLAGKAFAPDHAALERATRRFAALPLAGELVSESEGVALSATATLLDAPVLDHAFATQGVWQLAVTATDPLLYGPPTFAATTLAATGGGTGLPYPLAFPLDYGVPPGVTPGAITLANAGTAAYWPRVRIDGPVPNPSVTMVETGDTVRYSGTVAAGQWLDIDCGNRRVLLRGSEDSPGISVRHLVSSSGRWLAVPVGGGSLTWTADAADPAASLSAWGYEGAWL